MERRTFILSSAAFVAAARPAVAAEPLKDFDTLLKSVTPSDIENAAQFTELNFRQFVTVETQGSRSRGRSSLTVSTRARDLIVQFEVSGQQYYRKKLQSPIWPKGQSGVTIGIGYDVGYVEPSYVSEDWGSLLSNAAIAKLLIVAGKKGSAAHDALASVKDVVVPWDAALKQFDNFLPYVVAETSSAFDNLDLLSDDSRGALVSLVYNRGSAMPNKDSRKEMRKIRSLMRAKDFASVPEQIRSMKRLWQGNADMRGLLERRDLEALLFEGGL